jgi:hypothetical protein
LKIEDRKIDLWLHAEPRPPGPLVHVAGLPDDMAGVVRSRVSHRLRQRLEAERRRNAFPAAAPPQTLSPEAEWLDLAVEPPSSDEGYMASVKADIRAAVEEAVGASYIAERADALRANKVRLSITTNAPGDLIPITNQSSPGLPPFWWSPQPDQDDEPQPANWTGPSEWLIAVQLSQKPDYGRILLSDGRDPRDLLDRSFCNVESDTKIR